MGHPPIGEAQGAVGPVASGGTAPMLRTASHLAPPHGPQTSGAACKLTARPMPPPAPVTIATCPSSRRPGSKAKHCWCQSLLLVPRLAAAVAMAASEVPASSAGFGEASLSLYPLPGASTALRCAARCANRRACDMFACPALGTSQAYTEVSASESSIHFRQGAMGLVKVRAGTTSAHPPRRAEARGDCLLQDVDIISKRLCDPA